MQKPHYIYTQHVKLSATDSSYDLTKEWTKNEDKIIAPFTTYNTAITNEQYSLMDKCAGFNQVKTPIEIKKILQGNLTAKKRTLIC
jgi:hypothetical protein